MKKLKVTIMTMTLAILMSCGGGVSKLPANKEGFIAIEKELKEKFGDNAYFTDFNVTYHESIGNSIGVTVTDAPETLQMGEWLLSRDSWRQTSEITLEVPDGSKAADFMFQLNEEISLSKLGELVEKSIAQLKIEKNIKNPVLNSVFIKFPDNGDISKTEYIVMLKPEGDGTTFTFKYKLNGDLIEMDS